MEKAMGLSKEIYGELKNRFMITRPSSIKNLLADAVRRLNDRESIINKEKDEIRLENTPIEKFDDSTAVSGKEVKNELKSLMEDF